MTTQSKTEEPATSGEPQWLDAEQQRLWRWYLDGTARFMEAVSREHEKRLPLSLNEYELLVRLSESPDRSVRMSVLAEGLGRSRSRLTHTVARMEKRGLVVRKASTKDGRGVNCVMTDEGYALLVESAPGHVAAVRRFMIDVLTPEQFQTLGQSLHAVSEECIRAGVTGRVAATDSCPMDGP